MALDAFVDMYFGWDEIIYLLNNIIIEITFSVLEVLSQVTLKNSLRGDPKSKKNKQLA